MIARLIGRVLRKPKVHNWLLEHARGTPDAPILSPDETEVYMNRYWLFNPIGSDYTRKYPFIPFSIRIHNILRHDQDRHMHDHPFNARTWIMRGGYNEVRLVDGHVVEIERRAGDTSTLGFDSYHKITRIEDGGALTFFMFGPYKGQWGFLVDGHKMLHRQYVERFKQPLRVVVNVDDQVTPQLKSIAEVLGMSRDDIFKHVRTFEKPEK